MERRAATKRRQRRPARYTYRLRLFLSEAARDALEGLADRNDRLMSDMVRAALDAHLTAAETGEPPLVEPVGHGPWASDTTVAIRPEAAERLGELADRHGRSLSAEARAAIDAYLRNADIDLPAQEPSLLSA